MVTIGLYQSLSNSALHKHIFLENIRKLYKSSGKCDDQQKYKAIIESDMVYNTEEVTKKSPVAAETSVTMKKPSARKLLSQILALIDVKQKLLSAYW